MHRKLQASSEVDIPTWNFYNLFLEFFLVVLDFAPKRWVSCEPGTESVPLVICTRHVAIFLNVVDRLLGRGDCRSGRVV